MLTTDFLSTLVIYKFKEIEDSIQMNQEIVLYDKIARYNLLVNTGRTTVQDSPSSCRAEVSPLIGITVTGWGKSMSMVTGPEEKLVCCFVFLELGTEPRALAVKAGTFPGKDKRYNIINQSEENH